MKSTEKKILDNVSNSLKKNNINTVGLIVTNHNSSKIKTKITFDIKYRMHRVDIRLKKGSRNDNIKRYKR